MLTVEELIKDSPKAVLACITHKDGKDVPPLILYAGLFQGELKFMIVCKCQSTYTTCLSQAVSTYNYYAETEGYYD